MNTNEVYGLTIGESSENTMCTCAAPNIVSGSNTDGIETTPNEVYGIRTDGIETVTVTTTDTTRVYDTLN